MLQPTGSPPALVLLHTHLVRGGFLMLQPTGRPPALVLSHTHLVRGGFLMF
jgi:hypothetical protein